MHNFKKNSKSSCTFVKIEITKKKMLYYMQDLLIHPFFTHPVHSKVISFVWWQLSGDWNELNIFFIKFHDLTNEMDSIGLVFFLYKLDCMDYVVIMLLIFIVEVWPISCCLGAVIGSILSNLIGATTLCSRVVKLSSKRKYI